MLRSVRALVAVWAALFAAACGPPPGDPAAVVLRAFDAYRRGDAAVVQATLDIDGRGTAARWCKGGLALECLRNNYFGLGDLVSREAKVGGWDEEEGLLGVRLTTLWSPPRELGQHTRCQFFTLSYAGRSEWRIHIFDTPRKCS